jgi:hypothetical protein
MKTKADNEGGKKAGGVPTGSVLSWFRNVISIEFLVLIRVPSVFIRG